MVRQPLQTSTLDMTPRTFLTIALTTLLASPLHAARNPNILVIVADDLGYGETTVQGFSKQIPTPNIDSIAENGIRFTNGYVSGPYCSPTRAGLVTGRYQERFGHEFNPGPQAAGSPPPGLSLDERTIGNRMKELGYTTGWFGKSHLGYAPRFHPLKRGFDEFYGFFGASHSYLRPGSGRNAVFDGYEPVADPGYLTQTFARKTAGFIERNANKPWFAYLAFNAVHAPLETLERYDKRFSSIRDPERRKFAALLSALDDSVGEVLGKISQLGLEQDTLIFFISDNGGPTRRTTSNNGPLKGYKAQTSEGGIRVPFFVQWKGNLPRGVVDNRPVIQLDILPTSLAAAGGKIDSSWKLDGVNLLPYLKHEIPGSPHEVLYWRFGEQFAVRKGNWKLVKSAYEGVRFGAGTASTRGAKLYNLAEDIGERNDLAKQRPEKARELARLWNQWNSSLATAAWPPDSRPHHSLRHSDPVDREEDPETFDDDLPFNHASDLQESSPLTIAALAGKWPPFPGFAFLKYPALSADVITDDDSEGVIVARGGNQDGLALHVSDGRLTFSMRREGLLTSVVSGEALGKGHHHIEVWADKEGLIDLKANGKIVGTKFGLLPTLTENVETVSIGSDPGSAVGDYTAPNPFAGDVIDASIVPLKD